MTGDNMLTRWSEQLSRSDGEARAFRRIESLDRDDDWKIGVRFFLLAS